MLLEFVGQSSRDSDNIVGDPSRLMNVYRERAGDGVPWLKSVPAMMPHTALPGVFISAMGTVDGRLYAVCGGALFEVLRDGSFTHLGEVDHGAATIAGNNGLVTVQAGSRYFVWDGTAMSEPPTGAFAGFGSLEFFGNYTILTEDGGRMVQWSALADPTDLPGLSFSTADGRDDHLVRAFAIHGVLYLFKQSSHEKWALTGGAGAEALERIPAGVADVGLKSHGLICRFPGGAFMVGSDNRASLVAPGGLQPISTPPVETAIKDARPVACLHYADEGHDFCAIVFRDAAAWIYDIATGEWHERAEGANHSPWRAAVSAMAWGQYLVGRSDGRIATLQRTDIDGAIPLVREATSRTLYMDGARTVIRELELFARNGFSGSHIELSLSRDGGMTWTPWKPRPIGPVGEFARRIIWRNLGQSRRVNARIRWSAPSNINLSAQCRVTT